MSGMTSIVRVFGSSLVASRTQYIACWAIFSFGGCTYPIPFHLYWKAVPSDPKTLSLVYGD